MPLLASSHCVFDASRPVSAKRNSTVLEGTPMKAIRGAQPSARLSEEICLSEGSAGVLSKGSAGSLRRALLGSAGVRGIFRGFSGVVTLCLRPLGTVGPNDNFLFLLSSPRRPRMSGRRDVWGVPGQVWEFRFLLPFPLLPRENRSSRDVWEKHLKSSQTSVFQTSAAFIVVSPSLRMAGSALLALGSARLSWEYPRCCQA